MYNIKKKIEKNILLLSPYSDDHARLLEISSLKYSYKSFSSSSQLYAFLNESNLNYIILISSKIDDDLYSEVVKKIFSIIDDANVIIYSQYASVEEVSSIIQLGVFHFSVGENCFFDLVSAIDKFFDSNVPIDSEYSLSLLNNSRGKDSLFILENIHSYFPSYKANSIELKLNTWLADLEIKKNNSILIIEDEQMYLTFLLELLSENYIAEGVGLAESAILKVKCNFYPVILVDLFLPDKDGVKLVEELRLLSPLSEIVVITAFDLPDSASDIFKLGINSYLNKPILKDKLFSVIADALQIVNKKSLNNNIVNSFLSKELTQDQKIDFIKALAKLKLEQNKKLLIEDVFCFFPELKIKNFPSKMVFPLFDSDSKFNAYINGLITV